MRRGNDDMKELCHQQHMIKYYCCAVVVVVVWEAAQAAVLSQLPIPILTRKIYIENICLGLVLTHEGHWPPSPYGIEHLFSKRLHLSYKQWKVFRCQGAWKETVMLWLRKQEEHSA